MLYRNIDAQSPHRIPPKHGGDVGFFYATYCIVGILLLLVSNKVIMALHIADQGLVMWLLLLGAIQCVATVVRLRTCRRDRITSWRSQECGTQEGV